MFKIRSIAVRLILAISLTVAVACGILGTFSIAQQRALTQLALMVVEGDLQIADNLLLVTEKGRRWLEREAAKGHGRAN